jgi:hypothetical protein
MTVRHQTAIEFIRESNRIEGIHGEVPEKLIKTYREFWDLDTLILEDMELLVQDIQPGATLRQSSNQNVQVGNHTPPRGGPAVVNNLRWLLADVNDWRHHGTGTNPWRTHTAYEALHPFTDGNGRSGRALWAWMQLKAGLGLPRMFLHEFYYQTLENSDR